MSRDLALGSAEKIVDSRDRVALLYSRSEQRAREAAKAWGVPRWTTDLAQAIEDPETDLVVVGLPNALHTEAVLAAARAGKPVLCTKPLATTAAEALEMLEAVERACYRSAYSKRWEAVELALWRGSREAGPAGTGPAEYDAEHLLLKQELMPDGRMKRILKEKKTGRIVERIG